jgi:hypothetical protein
MDTDGGLAFIDLAQMRWLSREQAAFAKSIGAQTRGR